MVKSGFSCASIFSEKMDDASTVTRMFLAFGLLSIPWRLRGAEGSLGGEDVEINRPSELSPIWFTEQTRSSQ